MKNTIPRVWQVDSLPIDTRYTRIGYVNSSIEIGVDVVPTFTTPEIVSSAVTLIGIPASGALLTGVPRINMYNLFTKCFGFISDKLLKLEETPIVEFSVELPSTSTILNSNAGEVFECKHIKWHIHDLFRDTMVNIRHKPFFFSTDLLKKTFSRLSAFTLEFSPKMFVFASNVLNLFTIKESIVRAHSNINDTPIDSKNPIARWFRRVCSHGNMEIERIGSLIVHKCRTSDVPVKILIVILGKIKSCFDSAADRCNTDKLLWKVYPDNSLVISNSSKWCAFRKSLKFNTLKCFTRNISDTLQESRRYFRVSFSDRVIRSMMDFYLTTRLILKSKSSDLIKCFVTNYDGLAKRLCIFIRDFKFEFDRSIHTHILTLIPIKGFGKTKRREAQFLPMLKHRGFLARSS